MRSHSTLVGISAFVIAATLSILAALVAVRAIETRSVDAVEAEFAQAQISWAHVEVDGLQIILTGTAPTEAARFRALTRAGTVVDATRIADFIDVSEAEGITPPQFSIEILQNAEGISLIGLIPAAFDRESFLADLKSATNGTTVTDFLQEAHYPAPARWEQALHFAYTSLAQTERSKVSISANNIQVTAITTSQEERAELQSNLRDAAPKGIKLVLDISAPRPVLTPFALRFDLTDGVVEFGACAADTPETQAQILAAAQRAGLKGNTNCTLGLGVPSTNWGKAVALGIDAVAELGGGTLSFADADVALIAREGTAPKLFSRVVAELEADLPELFSLKATLPETPDAPVADDDPIEFVATLSPEGQVQLRGRVPNERIRNATQSYAHARFGRDAVYAPLILDDTLPSGWPIRVFAGLAALAELNYGAVTVDAENLSIKGVTGSLETNARLAAMLAHQLPPHTEVTFDVAYSEALDPVAALPTPEECVSAINAVIQSNKITFAPGADTLAAGGSTTLDQIAALMEDCEAVPMEIAGHTDSQGRESMNRDLSQARAEAVINALMARRVLAGNLTAKGYGESAPIATNDTEEGREENRRIEFTLLLTDEEKAAQSDAEAKTTEDSAEKPASTDAVEEDATTTQEADDERN